MQHSSALRIRIVCAAVAALGLGALSANQASAANLYFDNNGTTSGYGTANNGSYNWDDNVWASATGGTSATSAWVQGSFARFNATSTNYTITVANDEQMAGMYETVSGVSLTINATGAGTLDVVSGDQGFLVSGAASKLTINAPISGPGAVAPELSGSLFLYGNNTYSGGTKIGYSGATLTYFNNNNSFGTGPIVNNYAATPSFAALLATGGSTITLANDFQVTTSGNGFNFASAANTPVISTGNWSMGANDLLLKNNGPTSSPLTIAGPVSGSANITLSGNNGGAVIFTDANTFAGTMTVGASGSTSVVLKLGASDTLASSAQLILAGGTLDPDGLDQHMSATTLGLTAASTLDFAAGASELDFANSSGLTWTGTLNLLNFDPSLDKLRFGTDATGLTSDQLADIEFNGAGLGTAGLDAAGYLVVPEPASLSLLGLGATALLARRRRV